MYPYWPFKLVGKLLIWVGTEEVHCTSQLFRDGTLLVAGHCFFYPFTDKWLDKFLYMPISGFPKEKLTVQCVCAMKELRKHWNFDYDYGFVKLAFPPKLNTTDEYFSPWSLNAVDKVTYAFGVSPKFPQQCVNNTCIVYSTAKRVENTKKLEHTCNDMGSGCSGGVIGYLGWDRQPMAVSVNSYRSDRSMSVNSPEYGPILDEEAKDLWEFTKNQTILFK